jgi:WD40 repeat protein
VAESYLMLAPGSRGGVDEEIDRTQTRVWSMAHLDRRPETIEVPWVGLGETMALSPHGDRVYLSAPVAAYSVRTGKPLWHAHVSDTWLPMDVTHDGRYLAVSPTDTSDTIALVSTRHGRVERVLKNASGGVNDLTFSDDGSHIAAVTGDRHLVMWNRRNSQPTDTIEIDGADGVQLSPDGQRAYVSDYREGTVVTWDLTGGSSYLKLVATHRKLSTVQVGFLRTSADGTRLAEYQNALRLFNATTGKVTTAEDPGDWGFFTPGSWRPDDHRFAIGTLRGHVQVFDEDGAKVRDGRVSRVQVADVDYSADGTALAVDDVSGRVGLRDADTLEAVGTPVDLPGATYGLTLAPDGHTAFVVTRRGEIRPGEVPTFPTWALLDLEKGRVLRTGSLPEAGALFDDFSPDGRRVAVGLDSGRVLILDPHTGTTVAAPEPTHSGGVDWLAWTADGSHIISTGSGGLQLWDPSTGQVLDSVETPNGGIGQFRGESAHVTIVDMDGRVLDWDTSRQHALDYACRIAGRDLTADEWSRYLGDQPRFQVCPS